MKIMTFDENNEKIMVSWRRFRPMNDMRKASNCRVDVDQSMKWLMGLLWVGGVGVRVMVGLS